MFMIERWWKHTGLFRPQFGTALHFVKSKSYRQAQGQEMGKYNPLTVGEKCKIPWQKSWVDIGEVKNWATNAICKDNKSNHCCPWILVVFSLSHRDTLYFSCLFTLSPLLLRAETILHMNGNPVLAYHLPYSKYWKISVELLKTFLGFKVTALILKPYSGRFLLGTSFPIIDFYLPVPSFVTFPFLPLFLTHSHLEMKRSNKLNYWRFVFYNTSCPRHSFS